MFGTLTFRPLAATTSVVVGCGGSQHRRVLAGAATLAVLVGSVSGVFGVTSASAAVPTPSPTVVESAASGVQTTGMHSISLPGFPESLGTLTSVTASVTGQISGYVKFQNDDAYVKTIDNAQLIEVQTLQSTAGKTLVTVNPTQRKNLTLPASTGQTDFMGPNTVTFAADSSSSNTQTSTYTDAATLSSFTSANALTLPTNCTSTYSTNGDAGNLDEQVRLRCELSATITYTYLPRALVRDDPGSTVEPGHGVTIPVIKNDDGQGGSIDPTSVTIAGNPKLGTVVVNADGTVTYTPNPGVTTGTDTFTYNACDDATQTATCSTSPATATVVIQPQADLSIAKTGPPSETRGSQATYTLKIGNNGGCLHAGRD